MYIHYHKVSSPWRIRVALFESTLEDRFYYSFYCLYEYSFKTHTWSFKFDLALIRKPTFFIEFRIISAISLSKNFSISSNSNAHSFPIQCSPLLLPILLRLKIGILCLFCIPLLRHIVRWPFQLTPPHVLRKCYCTKYG